MTPAGWLALAAALGLLAGPPRRSARHRAGVPAPVAGSVRPGRLVPGRDGRSLALTGGCALLTASAVVALAGPAAVVIAPLAALGVGLMVRRLDRQGRRRPLEPRSVALVLDLLATALAAGGPPESAIAAVAAAVTEQGTVAMRLAVEPIRLVGRLLRLGSDPVAAWSGCESIPGLQPVAAAGRRCAHSGARLATALAETAAEIRARHRSESVARAERVGVWSLLPLGCCFLPAFVCLGVVPVVLGVAGQVLGGG